ncbi:MAG TPA: SDR family oxidoreductase [Bryobacteraceae bacterium]|jgi:NAD(P)-dependent dehydrogenase (short-subunit alcohol dehydrogenase family)|nr:SDR family oxidoreductase [Bryobacteraceae bacterium]
MKRKILLVGGSGGLGRVSARLLAQEGAELIVTFYRNRECAEKLRDIAQIVQADITQVEDREQLLDRAGTLDGLVVFTGNPARIASKDQTLEMLQVSDAINYMGPILLGRAAAERMQQSRTAGAIVFFSTMQGVALFPNSTIYAGAKAALIHAARILAKEVRADNIRVNVIAPGVISAGMAEASIASGKYDRYLQENTIARFGRPEDIARAVQFLLAPDNYITGQVLSVDGGITL